MKAMLEWSATELSAAIHARKVAPSEVMAAWLAQVEAVNPAVNALVSLRDPDALMAEARALDDVQPHGWLHGIPFGVKDLVATKGVRTTWGSPLFADHVPVRDDLVAARLRASGAVIAGKTNVPEWGQGSHSFNPVFGVTRNPYDLSRGAGGSSGGAAAALATRMAERSLRLGGTITGEHGVGFGKLGLMAAEHGAAWQVMGAVKAALDPFNLMNPGKVVPRQP